MVVKKFKSLWYSFWGMLPRVNTTEKLARYLIWVFLALFAVFWVAQLEVVVMIFGEAQFNKFLRLATLP